MTAVYIILVIIFWGVWGVFGKIATKYNHEYSVIALSYLIYPLTSLILFFLIRHEKIKISWDFRSLSFICLAAGSAILGTAFYYIALAKGNTAIVVSLCALYPAITLIFALFVLNEKLTLQQIIGIAVILIGIFLISYTPAKATVV